MLIGGGGVVLEVGVSGSRESGNTCSMYSFHSTYFKPPVDSHRHYLHIHNKRNHRCVFVLICTQRDCRPGVTCQDDQLYFPKLRLEIVRQVFAYHGRKFYRDLLNLIKYKKSSMREMTIKRLKERKNDEKSG